MEKEIELLPKKRKEEKAWRSQKLNKAVMVVLASYLAFIAGLLGTVFFTSNQLSSVLAQKRSLEEKIKGEEKKENLAVLLKDRLSKQNLYYKAKVNYKDIFEVIASLTPEGVVLGETKIEKDKLLLDGRADSLASLKDFLERLDALLDQFLLAKLANIAKTREGEYAFSLELTLTAAEK